MFYFWPEDVFSIYLAHGRFKKRASRLMKDDADDIRKFSVYLFEISFRAVNWNWRRLGEVCKVTRNSTTQLNKL